MIDKLEASNVLDNTYIVYTSDHGYKLGQWRVGTSKQHPYETDIKVPFFIRGPGVAANKVVNEMTGNVDLLPTFLEWAGASDLAPSGSIDGKSLVPLMGKEGAPSGWRDAFLSEYLSVGTYFFDHSDVYTTNKTQCGGPLPAGPHVHNDSDCKEVQSLFQCSRLLVLL